jgi:hypothetical protein
MRYSHQFGNSGFLGLIEEKSKPVAYRKMKQNQINKRRAKNKVARRSRRINRLRKEGLLV